MWLDREVHESETVGGMFKEEVRIGGFLVKYCKKQVLDKHDYFDRHVVNIYMVFKFVDY